MQMRSPTRQSAARIWLKPKPDVAVDLGTSRDEPQQLGGRRAFTASDAGTHRCRALTVESNASNH